jgi:predicted MFS family arabinose efflux permease
LETLSRGAIYPKCHQNCSGFSFSLGVVYIIFFLFGEFTIPMAIITLFWEIIAGIGANINQYWVMSSAPEAPTFANDF